MALYMVSNEFTFVHSVAERPGEVNESGKCPQFPSLRQSKEQLKLYAITTCCSTAPLLSQYPSTLLMSRFMVAYTATKSVICFVAEQYCLQLQASEMLDILLDMQRRWCRRKLEGPSWD
jgi:hypothetical protein